MASHGLAKLLALAVVDPDSGKPRMCNALELAKGAAAEFGPHVGLQNFCFPEYADKWSPIHKHTRMEARLARPLAEVYTFTLTGGDGSRTLGFCRRFLPAGQGERYPQVLCLLSSHPWFTIFSEVLRAVEPYVSQLQPSSDAMPASSPISAMLLGLASVELPPPGKLIPPPHVAGGPMLPPLRVPVDRGTGAHNADVFFAPLLWRVPVASVMNLLAALLNERRVVITATDLSALSAAVHAAAAMLYPMQWQHILLPVLPASLLDYLAAPMPFLVGVPAALAPAMARQPMEEVVHLDLDTGKIDCFADLSTMPSASGKKLQAELNEVLKSRVHNDAAIAAALRHFFVQTMGDYRKFVHTPPRAGEPKVPIPADALRSGGLWFDHASYVAATRSPTNQAFRHALRHTQMFETFITSRMDAIAAGGDTLADDAFERAIEESRVSGERMSQAKEAAAAAGAAAAHVAKEKAKVAWGSITRLGERAAASLENAFDRAELAAAKHMRSGSYDNLPVTGGSPRASASGSRAGAAAGAAGTSRQNSSSDLESDGGMTIHQSDLVSIKAAPAPLSTGRGSLDRTPPSSHAGIPPAFLSAVQEDGGAGAGARPPPLSVLEPAAGDGAPSSSSGTVIEHATPGGIGSAGATPGDALARGVAGLDLFGGSGASTPASSLGGSLQPDWAALSAPPPPPPPPPPANGNGANGLDWDAFAEPPKAAAPAPAPAAASSFDLLL